MSNPRTRRDRERARQHAKEQTRQHHVDGAQRRRRIVVGVVAVVAVGAMMAGFVGALAGGSTSSTTSTSATSSTLAPQGLKTTDPAAGAEMAGPTPCPAEDGSSPRTTTFAAPPPSCIDNSYFYTATISTTKGDMKININPQQAPGAANNFVVLSRYHYYDGQPFSTILPRMAAGVSGQIDNSPGRESPGYTLPGEAPAAGQIFIPGSIAMVPKSATDPAFGAAFLIATFDQAPGLPQSLSQFGIMVDGADTLRALDKAASKSGEPTEIIAITGITVTQGVKVGE